MTEVKDVLAWANEAGTYALQEARAGNPMPANRLGANSAMKLYFDNVVATKNVPDTAFANYYGPQFKELTHLYEAYLQEQKVTETVDKVTALESKFDTAFAELKGMIEKLTEAAPPAKRGRPKTKPEPEESEDEETEAEA